MGDMIDIEFFQAYLTRLEQKRIRFSTKYGDKKPFAEDTIASEFAEQILLEHQANNGLTLETEVHNEPIQPNIGRFFWIDMIIKDNNNPVFVAEFKFKWNRGKYSQRFGRCMKDLIKLHIYRHLYDPANCQIGLILVWNGDMENSIYNVADAQVYNGLFAGPVVQFNIVNNDYNATFRQSYERLVNNLQAQLIIQDHPTLSYSIQHVHNVGQDLHLRFLRLI